MSIEERLTDAITARTEAVEPQGQWSDVRRRALAARRRRRIRRAGALTAGLALAATATLLAVGALQGDPTQRVEVGPVDPSPPATTVPPTTTAPPSAPGDQERAATWVFDSGLPEARAAATAFAEHFLGMIDPVVGELTEGRIEIRPFDRGPTTEVALLLVDGTWRVTGASSANIRLLSPTAGESVATPIELRGRARAFEGTVQVEVRELGRGAGEGIGRAFVTGSGGPDLGPFEGTVEFGPTSTSTGALVLTTDSAEDGRVLEATVVAIEFAPCTTPAWSPGPPGPGQVGAIVWFACADGYGPAQRNVAAASPLHGALAALLSGPVGDEAAVGLSSPFGPATEGLLGGVTLTSEGTAIVDLTQDLATVIAPADPRMGETIVGQLVRTIGELAEIERVELRLGGSCEAFWEWISGERCRVVELLPGHR